MRRAQVATGVGLRPIGPRFLRTVLALMAALAFGATPAPAATLTVQTNELGSTPDILAYNSGHFYPGSNTREWWRYAGVSGVRMFIAPSNIEPSDDLAPEGDGVNSQAAFLARRAAIRTNQFNPAYINWSVFSNNYQNNDLAGNNHIKVNFALGELRQLGIRICAQITASQSRLPIADTNDWPNMWELWQHYYAQAFYLGRYFDVERYQMYNEPNHPNANGLTITNHLLRLQLVSDAVQLALADVNALYGKSLSPKILAPVSAGSADSAYPGWGESVVTNRHVNFLGQTDTNFSLINVYDYHQYGASPSGFGGDLANLNDFLAADMSPEPRLPTAISEFNTHTGATFDTMAETLDSPTEYPLFGGIAVKLMENLCRELYCFKFSQTERASPTTYPVAKNAMHYVDNNNAPYNVGGITKAGEVWRLFNKAFAPGRQRLNTVHGSGATSLDVHASYDPATQRYCLFSVNNTTSDVSLSMALDAWNIPTNNLVLVEEVGEGCYGAGRVWTNAGGSRTVSGTLGARSVWLLTAPARVQQPEQIIAVTDDAEVRDGTNKGVNYGTNAMITVQNDPTNAANRSVAFLKFHLTATNLANLEFALLSVYAAGTTDVPIQAHVYGVDSNNWFQNTIWWTNAANLKDNRAAGSRIADNIIEGLGTNAHLAGQLVVDATNAYERLIDVTEFVRGLTDSEASFLISQDPRWDVTLPSLEPGDVQAGGIRIVTQEGASTGTPGPRLRLVFNATTNPPVAVDDAATTTQGVAVVISVLANDYDVDGETLTIQSFTQGANGSVSNNGNGTLTYAPDVGFSGPDSFTYTVTDGQGGASSANVSITVSAVGGTPYWTNLVLTTEAFIRGGVNATTDPDEVGTNYIMVKYNSPSLDNSRKAYFQFDLTAFNVDGNTQALFTIGLRNTYKQNVQLWGLNQAYTDFTSAVTWNTAQANDTASNNLLTGGALNATPIGAVTNIPASDTAQQTFTVPLIGNYVRGNRVTLVLSGSPEAGGFTNNPSGLRLLRTNATLQVLVVPPVPPAYPPPLITGITAKPNGGVTLAFLGATNRTHWLQATTNLAGGTWVSISTNVSSTNGTWSFNDLNSTNFPQRFYRAVLP